MDIQYPLISCICITRNKPGMLRRSIECFLAQTYQNKELIILYEDDDLATGEFLVTAGLTDTGIRILRVSAHPKITLGELRNRAIMSAKGEFICQWDDDDWYHMRRLEVQYKRLLEDGRHGSTMTRWLLFDSVTATAYISHERLWEGSILCRKSVLQLRAYEDKSIGEDTATIEYLVQRDCLCFLNDTAILYIYVYHGNNTWKYDHWSAIFKCSEALTGEETKIILDILQEKQTVREGSLRLDEILERLSVKSISYVNA